MVAVIGGETHRFKPLIDLYRQAGKEAGHAREQLKVGLHSLGYVANTREEAIQDFYPGYAEMFNRIGKERGFPPVTRAGFDAQNGPLGALLVGSPEEVAEKILRHSKALGGISRFTFQMDVSIPHKKLMESIELIGSKVSPLVKDSISNEKKTHEIISNLDTN
jgi:alkanesulfonate monooxygenase SsuD/methylene tetrahydromethanopterin reductase-like flavin-dependent oxidoreductase (luciferase family)